MRTREELKEIAQEEFLRQQQEKLTMPRDGCQIINETKESLFARYKPKIKLGEGTQSQELFPDAPIYPYAVVNEELKKMYTAKIKRVGNPKTEAVIAALKKMADKDNRVYITYNNLVNAQKS